MSAIRNRLLRAWSRAGAPPAANAHHASVERAFRQGFLLAVETPAVALVPTLRERLEPYWRAYAWEGAGMALARLCVDGEDCLRAVSVAAEGLEVTLLSVGAGMGFAAARAKPPEPPAGWCAEDWTRCVADGRGFHTGRFSPWKLLGQRRIVHPRGLERKEAFDVGVGRSLLFVYAGEEGGVLRAIEGFDSERHAALWQGVGVAAAFTGGLEDRALAVLRVDAGDAAEALGLGVEVGSGLREAVSGADARTRAARRILTGR